MRYWWVNQNQTFRHEIEGGYLWSPKRNANGARNPFYESMREVAPGDLIFSFMDTRILAVGIRQSYCWESPKPLEFGATGENWENIGWKVKVSFTKLANKVRPKDHIELLRPLLPARYSPLQPNGNGLQSVYLTEVPGPLAEVIIGLIGQEVAPLAFAAHSVKPIPADDLDSWERKIEQEVVSNSTIPETDRLAIVRARNGQGLFKERVSKIESRCRITGVENPAHLIASHCKPWRDSTNEERLNGENGLLLTRSRDVKAEPQMAREVYRILREGKRMAGAPAQPDPIPFGIEANRDSLGMVAEFAFQQGLLPRRVSVDDMFVETRALLET